MAGLSGKNMKYWAGRSILSYFCRICFFQYYKEIFEEIYLVAMVFYFYFLIEFSGCTAWLRTFIIYNITQLSCFIKFVHQICHCNTALSQMIHFLMTDWSHLFPCKINQKLLNVLGDFVAWLGRHVIFLLLWCQIADTHNQILYNHHLHLSHQACDLQRVLQTTYYIITPRIHLYRYDQFILIFAEMKNVSVYIVSPRYISPKSFYNFFIILLEIMEKMLTFFSDQSAWYNNQFSVPFVWKEHYIIRAETLHLNNILFHFLNDWNQEEIKMWRTNSF